MAAASDADLATISLNLADCDPYFGVQREGEELETAFRKPGSTAWVGARATVGAAGGGKWVFETRIKSQGAVRVGFSTAAATLELGMDALGFGYGATGTKSNNGKYARFGQSFGKGDAILCLLDLDRHVVQFFKNGVRLPGDAFKVPQDLWNEVFFPHVLVKDATFEVEFGIKDPVLPPQAAAGCFWVGGRAAAATKAMREGTAWRARSAKIFDPSAGGTAGGEGKEGSTAGSSSRPSEADLLAGINPGEHVGALQAAQAAEVGVAKELPEWKVQTNRYCQRFRELLSHEHEAEKQQVADRMQRPLRVLQMGGFGASGLTGFLDQKKRRGRLRLVRVCVLRVLDAASASSQAQQQYDFRHKKYCMM